MSNIDKVLNIANSLKGIREYSEAHKTIVQTYNDHRPLARGYKVQLSDPWCMAFVSYCFISAGCVDALGITECGCQDYLDYARSHNMLVQSPKRGDIVLYDWHGDGHSDHVGIVVNESPNGYINVIEGNKSDTVGIRNIRIKSEFIKAFVRPRWKESEKNTVPTYSIGRVSYADSFDEKIAGNYKCTASDYLALRYGPGTAYGMIDEIQPGDTVRCYGYFTGDWYMVVYKSYTGFCHKNWLKKV